MIWLLLVLRNGTAECLRTRGCLSSVPGASSYCVGMRKLFNFSVPQLAHQWNGDNSIYLTVLLRALSELTHMNAYNELCPWHTVRIQWGLAMTASVCELRDTLCLPCVTFSHYDITLSCCASYWRISRDSSLPGASVISRAQSCLVMH